MSKITRFIRRNFGQFVSMFRKRNKDVLVFGSWYGLKFADNPKYLFLYCLKKGLNAYWITKDQSIYDSLKGLNYPVEMAYSSNGKKICKCAKYVFTCTGVGDVNENCIGGAVLIDTTHGLPLKKYLYDDKVNGKCFSLSYKINRLFEKLPQRKTYVISSSKEVTKIYESAFRVKKKKILELGMPRNDCFFNGDLSKIVFPDKKYDKLILYLPTHRNEGKTPISLQSIFDLKSLNDYCVKNNILFVVKRHFYHNSEKEDLTNFSNIIDITGEAFDTQQLMFSSDYLITDYSSCFIDYLLLDKPILFYAFDYKKYQAMDRELYFDYKTIAPGFVCTVREDFMFFLNKTINGGLSKKQIEVKNIYYSTANQGEVSERFIETIKSL